MSDYLFDKQGEDAEVAQLEQLLGGLAHDAPLAPLPARLARERSWLRIAVPAAVLAAAAAVILLLVRRDHATAPCATNAHGFAFSVAHGAARCGGASVVAGVLPVGGWLETAADSVTNVRIADIGELVVFGGSQVRLVGTGPDRHRIELARGRLSAKVTAPPRLFVVDTPGAAAVDLGCAYELEVDSAGRTHQRVTDGEVSLERAGGAVAYVPSLTEVIATPGGGPGVPVATSASTELRAAVDRFDAGDASAVAAILASAGPKDTITLWNVLARVGAPDRAAVAHALDARSPRPAQVSEAAVLAGDRAALEAWRADVANHWFGVPPADAPPGKR
jgi:hypothetical protein